MKKLWRRIVFAFRAFFSILFRGRIAGDIVDALRAAPDAPAPEPSQPEAPLDRAVQMLALLQRDGRLVDFLMEDLSPYPDTQVGAAVRNVHAGCRQTLERYVTLEAILAGTENQPITVDGTIDPGAVKLVGNVAGRPPYHGLLRHRGWRSTQIELPPLSDTSRSVVAPAEVEVP